MNRAGRIITPFIFFALTSLLFAEGEKMRQWKSGGGNHTISAKYLGMKGSDKILLLKKNDKVLSVNLKDLSEEDQEYVEEQENPEYDGTGLTIEEYTEYKEEAETRFDEIQKFKNDEEFQEIGFERSGPFYRWQLQVRRLKIILNRRLTDSESEKTNADCLAEAVTEIQELGSEYEENGGKASPSTKKRVSHIQEIFKNLTNDPAEPPQKRAKTDSSEGGEEEPNPFTEEDSETGDGGHDGENEERVSLASSGKNAGPQSHRPRIKEENSENPKGGTGKKQNLESPLSQIPDIGSLGNLIGDIAAVANAGDDGTDTGSFHESNISHAQFEMITGDMTKEDVFAILGEGNKIRIPFSGTFAPGFEVYVWKNEGDTDICEVTFLDGKTFEKAWHGKSSK